MTSALRKLAEDNRYDLIHHQVESIRVRMRVPMESWAFALGVSRATYSRWINKGGPIRKSNLDGIESLLAAVMVLIERGWLESEHQAKPDKERGAAFQYLLTQISDSFATHKDGQM